MKEEEITEKDLCAMCKEKLHLVKNGYKKCPECGSRYCSPCFEKHIASGDLSCPNCGSGPAEQ